MRSPTPRDRNETDMITTTMPSYSNPFDTIVAVPFPDLWGAVSPRNNTTTSLHHHRHHHHHTSSSSSKTMKKRRRDVHVHAPTDSKEIPSSITTTSTTFIPPSSLSMSLSLAASAPATASAPISLPKSHVRRTPSELQLADNMRRAEDENVRMYSRLVRGMQVQDQVRQHHRLVSTDADEDNAYADRLLATDNAQQEGDEEQNDTDTFDDCGWDMSYAPIDDDEQDDQHHQQNADIIMQSMITSSSSSANVGVGGNASKNEGFKKKSSSPRLISILQDDAAETCDDDADDNDSDQEEEDDCFFSMEM